MLREVRVGCTTSQGDQFGRNVPNAGSQYEWLPVLETGGTRSRQRLTDEDLSAQIKAILVEFKAPFEALNAEAPSQRSRSV